MYKSVMALVLAGTLAALAGCASRAETVGTAGGAVVGNAATGGGALGTIGGAAVGYEAGKYYDQKHPK
jgi:osmotically inducible lipoprotein OsmB